MHNSQAWVVWLPYTCSYFRLNFGSYISTILNLLNWFFVSLLPALSVRLSVCLPSVHVSILCFLFLYFLPRSISFCRLTNQYEISEKQICSGINDFQSVQTAHALKNSTSSFWPKGVSEQIKIALMLIRTTERSLWLDYFSLLSTSIGPCYSHALLNDLLLIIYILCNLDVVKDAVVSPKSVYVASLA